MSSVSDKLKVIFKRISFALQLSIIIKILILILLLLLFVGPRPSNEKSANMFKTKNSVVNYQF